jgi:pimeloyl-ACP methyl ester carboxylesterase
MAESALPQVRAATLLIVGGHDEDVLELNRAAARHLHCPHEVAVIPGATHLFPEPGALDEVERLSRAWFERHLRPPWMVPAR